MASSDAQLPPPLIDLRGRIEQWRSTRPKRGPMPRDLWEEAARLAHERGVYTVSVALNLNYEALKGWTQDTPKKAKRPALRKAAKQSFVELAPMPAFSSPTPWIEVEATGGMKMTIRLSSMTAEDAASLLDTFLRNRRR